MTLKKYTIVFDLDETLIHTIDNNEWNSIVNKNDYINNVFDLDEDTKVIKRPGLDKFLDFVSNKFYKVGVWSAGIKPYVESIVSNIFKKNPHIVYSRFDCDYKIIYPYGETTAVKPLELIWDKNIGFTPINTFMIEDKYDTSLYNPHNLILIPAFKPLKDINMIKNDNTLEKLMDFFTTLDNNKFKIVPLIIKPFFTHSKDE